MYKFLTKNGTALGFGLGLFVSLIAILTIVGGLDEFNMLAEEDQGTTNIFNAAIWGAIVLVLLTFASAILFGLVQVISNPKSAIKLIISLAVIAGLALLFHATAEVETTGKIADAIADGELSGSTSKWISGALWTTLILFAATVAVFIFSEIRNVFK